MLCKHQDEYTEELLDRGVARWVVLLSDGTRVYQDDDRPGVEPKSAWLRLGEYFRHTNQWGYTIPIIQKMWLEFRSNRHTEILPENADAYFFCKSCIGLFPDAQTINQYVVGAVQEGVLTTQKWRVPELLHMETEVRTLDQPAGYLIWNRRQKGGQGTD